MTNTNLIDILRTFSSGEMKKFEEMIHSPFFNKDTPLTKLFEQLKKYHPEFKSEQLKKDVMYAKMFPDKKYNYGTMKNLIYDLQKLGEKFIALQELSKDEFEMKRSLISGFRLRNLTTLGEKNLKELENQMSGKEINEHGYFLKMYFINEIKRGQILETSRGNIHAKEKLATPYFNQNLTSSEYLKKYFLLDTVKMYNRIITNKNILDSNSAVKDSNEFIRQYENDFNEISLKLELNFLKLNLGKITEKEFLELKKMTLTDLYEMKADKSMTFAYSIYLLNYCRIKNQTDSRYLVHAFDVLKSIVANENYDKGTHNMDIVLSRNIIIVATQLHEFQWCEDFLKSNFKKFHPDFRENIINFYNAFKNFEEGKFEKSLEYLSSMKNDDIFNKLYIKELVVINYFELKYFDLLTEQIDSYKKFLVNNETLPDSYKIKAKLFVDFINELFRAVSYKKTDLHLLKKKISNEKDMIHKNWFLKKIDEIR